MVLRSIDFRAPKDGLLTLAILDQLLLPHNTVYIDLRNAEEAHAAIKQMKVRGAPAIALVAVLALAVELQHFPGDDPAALSFIHKKLDYLVTSRPTAVNLSDAVNKLKIITQNARSDVKSAYITAVVKMLEDDVEDNRRIGHFGAYHIMNNTRDKSISVVTICNTGSLATAGHGTAYSVINQLHQGRSLDRAFFCETRPYNQGARLTSAELLHDNIPSTMVLDSSIAALLSGARTGGKGHNIQAILVGADRVARNGDTANKIGTCQLAILAAHFGIQFLVCAPWTTIDLATASGDDIIVEERAQKEVRQVWGAVFDKDGKVKKTSEGIVEHGFVEVCSDQVDIWNPAFDVTPHEIISGIVTEHGVLTRDHSGSFQLAARKAALDAERAALAAREAH